MIRTFTLDAPPGGGDLTFRLADLGSGCSGRIVGASVYLPGAPVALIAAFSVELGTTLASIPAGPFPMPLPVDLALNASRLVTVGPMPASSVLVLTLETSP